MRVQAIAGSAPARSANQPVRVLLADDHAITLWGLRQLVSSAKPRMDVVGSASTCAELLTHPALPDTDVVLLDLGMSDGNAINCVRQLVQGSGVQVVLLTGDLNPRHHCEAVMRGARGVVLKSQPAEDVLEAISRVHAGEVWFDGALMSLLLGGVAGVPAAAGGRTTKVGDDADRRIDSLTPKERQVVEAVVAHSGAKGLVVAELLGMSEHTLRNHLTVIYSKLGVQGKMNLYVFAMQHGLMPHGVHDDDARKARLWGQQDSAWDALS
jgi:DNA-binding NarL/FixJ family response regulator